MRVVVTGATGFVGAQVVRSLLKRGDEVHAVARSNSDRRRLEGTSTQWLEADVLSEAGRARIAALEPDVCVGAAWYAEPGKYLSSPINVELQYATLALARSLAERKCRRFVGVGTCFEYETSFGLLSEQTPLAPRHLYSAAKAGTYFALKELAALSGMQAVWARLFYLYGPDEHPGRLVPSVARRMLRGEEARATPGGQVRDFLHVEDAGEALGALVHSDVVGAVNVASGAPVTVAAIVRELGTIAGRPDLVRLGALPYSPNDPMFICADVRKLTEATGWAPRWSLSEGLASVLAWWRREEQTRS